MNLNQLYTINFAVEMFFQDSDEGEEEKLPQSKIWNFVEITVPDFSDKQFQMHFRLSRESFEKLLNILHSLPDVGTKISGRPKTPVEKQLLLSLWYLGNIECFRSVANRFGVSKSTAWHSLYEICELSLRINVQQRIIGFKNIEETIRHFQRKTGFPGICGMTDGTHIPIVAPKKNHVSYINRKNFHSVVLQVTCNKKKEFSHCYAGEAGSVHDACVYRRSGLLEILNGANIPEDGHLLGDSAYPLSTRMIVPYKDNGHLTIIQKNFNKVHSQCRVKVEQSIGLLKGRFRRLKLCESRRLDFVCTMILTSCIFHNLCIEDIPDDINIEQEVLEERLMNVNVLLRENENEKIEKRNDIANTLYFRNLRNIV